MKSLLMTPKPYHDESLAGYIVRLTERNFYEQANNIYVMSGLSEITEVSRGNGNFLNPLVHNLERLSELTNCSIDELLKLSFSSVQKNSVSSFQFYNQPIFKEMILLRNTKVCPECLRDTAYHRKHWDLVPVTACIYHRKVLIDICPNCNKVISWSRTKVLECKCGQLLTQIKAVDCTLQEIEVSSLFYYIDLEHIPIKENKLSILNIDDIYNILTLFSWIYVDKNDRWRFIKHIRHSKSNQEIHNLFCKIYNVFNNWPINYYIFLDELNEN